MTVENKIAEKLTEKHQSALLIGTRDS